MNVKMVLLIVGAVLALIGVILIFDARVITIKMFSFGDQNDGVKALKIFGFILSVIGGIIILYNVI